MPAGGEDWFDRRVQGSRWFLRYWLPVVIWLATIFVGSTDLMSSSHTSRFIRPFLRWLVPGISESAIETVQAVVRKGGHMSEYAVLTLLLWHAVRRPRWGERRPWSSAEAARILLLAILCAAFDEFHQSFVPSREGAVRDVGFDTLGSILALAFIYALGRWRKVW